VKNNQYAKFFITYWRYQQLNCALSDIILLKDFCFISPSLVFACQLWWLAIAHIYERKREREYANERHVWCNNRSSHNNPPIKINQLGISFSSLWCVCVCIYIRRLTIVDKRTTEVTLPLKNNRKTTYHFYHGEVSNFCYQCSDRTIVIMHNDCERLFYPW